ncbi:MAG: nucleotidyltransferase family protein [Thermodesulfobacteriota bacterium]
MRPSDQALPVAAVVLAAGLSTRFGRPKQMLEIQGRLLLARVLQNVLASRLEPVILVLGHWADQITQALKGPGGVSEEEFARLIITYNPDYATGQSSSIRAGTGSLPANIEAVMFIMGDQIGLSGVIIEKILARAGQEDALGVVRPRYGRRPGGPILWRKKHFTRLMTLTGDQGGRSLLGDLDPSEVTYLDLPAEDEPFDLDTEADYQAWLSRLEE